MADTTVVETADRTSSGSAGSGTYSADESIDRSGQTLDLSLIKDASLSVAASRTQPAYTIAVNESLTETVVKTASQTSVHFSLTVSGDLSITQGGATNAYATSITITGDVVQTTSGTKCHVTTTVAIPDATTTFTFTSDGGTGVDLLTVANSKVASSTSSTTITNASLANAGANAVINGGAALLTAFSTSSSDPVAGFNTDDKSVLASLGQAALTMIANPSSTSAAANAVLSATNAGAKLALDDGTAAYAVADTAPHGLALNSASDSGTKGDAITNLRQVQIDGTAVAGDAVTLYDGAVAVATGVASSTGAFHLVANGLADGAHDLTVTAANASGSYSASSSDYIVTVDTQALTPVVAGVTTRAVSGTGEAGAKVAVYDNNVLAGTATVAADGTWSLAHSITGTASHTITTVETDAAGNKANGAGSAIFSAASNAHLNGGTGDDVIFAGSGDTLTGGGGHDLFVFDTTSGKASVADFVAGLDDIVVNHALAPDFATLMAHASQKGGSVVIAFDSTHAITLTGVSLSSLSAGDFVFV